MENLSATLVIGAGSPRLLESDDKEFLLLLISWVTLGTLLNVSELHLSSR